MANDSDNANPTGFKAMSQDAETGSKGSTQSGGDKSEVASSLKPYGVDTDQITELASERASELQKLIAEEIRARPMRALGWAAAAGVIFGFWAAK